MKTKTLNWLNKSSSIIQTLFTLCLLLTMSSTFAESDARQELTTPELLLNTKIENNQDVMELMNSSTFQNQMGALFQQLNVVQDDLRSRDQIALLSLAGDFEQVENWVNAQRYPFNYFQYLLHAKTMSAFNAKDKEQDFAKTLNLQLSKQMTALSDENLVKAKQNFGWRLDMGQDYLQFLFQRYGKNDSLTTNQAIDLLSNYQLYRVYAAVLEDGKAMLQAEQQKRFIIQPDVLIKTEDGATLSAVVVRKRNNKNKDSSIAKRPTAFQFTIYADEEYHIDAAIHAAAHGYVGVIANTRGKRLSADDIVPWEYDGKDATAVIDWIIQQPWSDGRVGMYGGSYNGFTQWAAAKYMHPALKTIVPYAAASPITGLPIENNIFITPNYQWAFHVTNNKTMDNSVYADWNHWENTYKTLFESGRAFKEIDQIEGTPNPWFQKWLEHPDYDGYYKQMLPFGKDYQKITIPVLSITGYFDGGQISAIDFLKRHYQQIPNAEHYLLIGPYNHRTAQEIPGSHHSNYKLDPVALEKDTLEITFQWFNHVFYNAPKPKLIKDKVNYQLMGSNTWQHRPSYAAMNDEGITYHLGTKSDEQGSYSLTTKAISNNAFVEQTVDMADRSKEHNLNPYRVNLEGLKDQTGLVFMTSPMDEAMELSGAITGAFSLAINKKDVDIGYNFYEIKSDGSVFHFNTYSGRASYANDMSKRQLLIPGEKTLVPIVNGRMTAKLIEKGSRLAIVVDVNKHHYAQVNMGTGKDVSDETIADAGEPLSIKWYSDSAIKIPLKKFNKPLNDSLAGDQ